MNDYKEMPVLFGPDDSLIGLIATPAQKSMAPVGCLLLNVGANHRVGPRRINVKLARQLAGMGVSSIRIDLAGLGDSRPASGDEHFRKREVLDLQAAMNLMQTLLGIERFVLVGLCSGAGSGLALCVSDPRMIGLLMFDGYTFPSRRARWDRSLQSFLAERSVTALLGRVYSNMQRALLPALHAASKGRTGSAAAAGPASIFAADDRRAVADLFCRSMGQIAERDVAVMFVYSATLQARDWNRDQLGPFVNEPFIRRAEYRFLPEVDHSLLSLKAQKIFMSVVCDWAMRVIQGSGRALSPSAVATGEGIRIPEPRVPTVLEHART